MKKVRLLNVTNRSRANLSAQGTPLQKKQQRTVMPWGIGQWIVPLLLIGFLVGCGSQSPLASLVGPTQTPIISPTSTATMAPTQELTIGSTRTRDADNMVMQYVPAGEFLMGSTDADPNAAVIEFPQHKIYLDAFWIDRTEVTTGMYAACVAEKACEPPMEISSPTDEYYYGNPDYVDYPVVFVSWKNATNYCQWAGVRLPSEAEWEKAARGEQGNLYPWGNEFDCHNGNFDDEIGFDEAVVPGGPDCDGYVDTSPVGSFPSGASPYGALDMAGNVWEWVSSKFYPYPFNALDGREDINSKRDQIVRGGAAGSTQDRIRAAARYSYWFPSGYHIQFGFRCASSMP